MNTVSLGRVFVGIFLAMVTACSSPEATQTEKKAVSEKASKLSERGKAAGKNPDRLAMEIYPAEPTSRDDLTVLVKGRIENPTFLWERNGAILYDQDGPRLPSGNFVRGDVVSVTVTGENGELFVKTTIANSPPRISSVLFEDPFIHRGVDIRVFPQAEDPDGDFLDFHFKWSLNGEDIHPWDSSLLPGDSFKKGDRISLEVTPFDGHDYGPVFQGQDIIIPNAPPHFLTAPPTQFRGGTYLYEAKAEDPDGDDVTYSLLQSPPGMTMDSSTGRVVWVIGRNDIGAHTIAIAAQDEEGLKTIQEYELNVAISQ
jgi:hypothetical protein